ncbi:MAG: phospholipid scramblase-related protein, partial [Candidatus Pacearchaeota archaeon]
MALKLPQTIHAKQEVEDLEALTGFETKNQYKILNNDGNDIGYAAEQSG